MPKVCVPLYNFMFCVFIIIFGLFFFLLTREGFSGCAVIKNLPINAGDIRDMTQIFKSGRSPGVGKGNPLQYSCLENL